MGDEWKRVIRQLSTSICLYLAIKDEQSTHGFYDKQALFPKCGTGGEVKNNTHSELEFVQWQA